ncbi:hypothetical protein B4U80_13728 [Leptotrombidium deliense]|uniref:C2H2-type domain-containing protein n=1 Tax=Leptotrombidium deliense TaxID=299467 RepID=A0A443SIC1_9ACAR|nr:hypothetical protein B4U80_13728 [Leptotrombidium deliense]
MGSYLSFFGAKTNVGECNGETAAVVDEGSDAAKSASSEIAIEEKQREFRNECAFEDGGNNTVNGLKDEINTVNSLNEEIHTVNGLKGEIGEQKSLSNDNISQSLDFEFDFEGNNSNIAEIVSTVDGELCSVSSSVVSQTNNALYDEVADSYNLLYAGNQCISSSLEATRDTIGDLDLNITEDAKAETNEEQDDRMEQPEAEASSFIQEKIGEYFFCTFPKCKSKFKKLGHFERHLNNVHDVKSSHPSHESRESTSLSSPQVDSSPTKHPSGKPFVCLYGGCNKAYKTRSSYVKHVEAHERESPSIAEPGYDVLLSGGKRKRNLSQTDRSSVSSRSGSVGSKSDRSSTCDSTTYQNGRNSSRKKRK